MGRYTSASVVKFKASISEELAHKVSNFYEENEEDEDGHVEDVSIQGWHINDSAVTFKKLYIDFSLIKDNISVNFVNEHEFDGEDWCIFSDTKSALETFLADFNETATIETNEAVQQTI